MKHRAPRSLPAKPAQDGARVESAPRIELRQLRYFLAVAEELNFTRAAEKMGIAQPPLSHQISLLERQLRVSLFRRSNREVSLTVEGKAFATYARRIINTTIQAADAVRSIANGLEGPLTVGAVLSSIYTLIPLFLPRLTAELPGIHVNFQEMTISQQILALQNERIDAGILRGPFSHPDFESVTIFHEPFVAVVPRSSELAKAEVLKIEQVVAQPLIKVRDSANLAYSKQMFSILSASGFDLNIVKETADTHTLISLVAAGVGCSLVPSSFQSIQIRQVRYIPLVEDKPKTTIQIAWRKDRSSPTLQSFVRLVKDVMDDVTPTMFAETADAVSPDSHKV